MFHKDYTFTTKESKKFKHFTQFLYSYGLNAWFDNESVLAARFFRKAVLQDVLYIDAWIKLAQAELVLGNPDKARTILKFTDRLTEDVYRWKWYQTLLAYDLGVDEIVFRNINFLVERRRMLNDAFQLLDTHLSANTIKAVEVLDVDNLIPFLKWLIRWSRIDDAEILWNKITDTGIIEEDILLRYIHFLISKKRIQNAAEIRRAHMGIEDLTNAGFENEMTRIGFDWRYTANSKDKWTIRRTVSRSFIGMYSLKIIFQGKENISFANLYQITPVDPLKTYLLSFNWRSSDITTDQGPFIDIYGYDCKGLYSKGPMMLGMNEWQEERIDFTVPEDCHAVVIRLRRQTSHRFDNKISGTLWLDNFKLKEMKKDRQTNSNLVIN